MIVTRTADATFTVQFESEEELRNEHRTNLSAGGLRIPTSDALQPNTHVVVTMRGPWGTDVVSRAMVVAQLPDGIAVALEGDPNEMLDRLLTKTVESTPAADEGDQKTSWDRLRGLSQTEKILLAVKADRSERAVLIQDNDPRVLLSVLRNPRLTVDEVVRIAKSSFLNFQIVDVIAKTGQWMANLDVRLGLVHNPKTPEALSLRILPTLPDSEVRAIARAGTKMSLKQAALRQLQGKS